MTRVILLLQSNLTHDRGYANQSPLEQSLNRMCRNTEIGRGFTAVTFTSTLHPMVGRGGPRCCRSCLYRHNELTRLVFPAPIGPTTKTLAWFGSVNRGAALYSMLMSSLLPVVLQWCLSLHAHVRTEPCRTISIAKLNHSQTTGLSQGTNIPICTHQVAKERDTGGHVYWRVSHTNGNLTGELGERREHLLGVCEVIPKSAITIADHHHEMQLLANG